MIETIRIINSKTKSLIKNNWLLIVKLTITLGLIIYLIQKIHLRNLFSVIDKLKYSYFLIVLILLIFNLYLQFKRWKTLLYLENPNLPNELIWKSLLIGFAAGTFTPVRAGEYFARKIPLKDFPLSNIISLTFIDKFMLMFQLIFWGGLASLGLMLFHYEVNIYIILSFFILFISFFLSLLTLFFSNRFYNFLRDWYRKAELKILFIEKLIKPIIKLDRSTISKLFIYSFLHLIVLVSQFAFLIFSFDQNPSFINLIIASILVLFTKTITPSLTIGEIGVREGASIYFFGIFGCNEAIAFNSSIIIFLLNLVLPALLGLHFLFKIRRNG